jgi:primosomal protein N''
MTPDDRPPNVERLDWRLTELETKVDRGFAEMRQDMRAQLTRLEGTVERMTFVDVKLYQSEQRAQDARTTEVVKLISDVEKRMSDRIDDTDARQHWTLGLLIGALIVALAGGLVRLALG